MNLSSYRIILLTNILLIALVEKNTASAALAGLRLPPWSPSISPRHQHPMQTFRSPPPHTNNNNYRPKHQQQQTTIGVGPPKVAIRSQQLKRVCYFRMDPKTEIRLSQVDGTLCTHVIMAFVRIDSTGNICLASDSDLGYLLEVAQFKRQYPDTKVMVSVFNEQEHNGFPKAALIQENRQRFARSAMEFLQHYQLDGLDLDWEFPNFPTTFVGREHERLGLTKILKALRSAIVENFYDRQVAQQHQMQAGNSHYNSVSGSSPVGSQRPVEPYLLTMAIAGQEAVLKASYELKQVANLCDWLNIMSYDYFLFKPYAPFTGPNSPLYSVVEPYVPIVNKLSIAWTLGRLLEDGIARDKIVMGVPTYARAYRLVFRNTQPAPFTLALGEKGGRIDDYMDYREVCDLLRKPDTVVEFDQRARVPYLLTDFGYTWVSYENQQSVREKVRFVLENQLAGYMTWNLNSDDFIGTLALSHESTPAAAAAPTTQPNGHLPTNNNNPDYNARHLHPEAPFPLHRAMFDEVRRLLEGQVSG